MKKRRSRTGLVCGFVGWIKEDWIVKLAVVLALLNIFLYIYSGIIPNPYPDGYVGKFENDANSEYAVMSLGIRNLQVTDGTVEISHIYRYQPWLWSESRKANI
jgi:hypothetical protein